MGLGSNALALALVMSLKDEASAQLEKVKGGLGGVKTAALAIGGAAVAGIGLLAAGLYDAAQAAGEEEVGIARLGAAVTATGADWTTASGAIETYIASQTARAALDDGVARDALSRLTTTTGDYKQAMDLLPLAMDLAAAKNMDLATASDIVGKVAMGNTGILSRYGIVLEEGATSTEALAEMQGRFAGQAEAFGNTYQGQTQKMDIALGNLKETIGAAVLPVLTQLAGVAADFAMRAIPLVEAALAQVGPIFQALFGWIRDVAVPVLQAIVNYVIDNWPLIYSTIQPIMLAVQTVIGEVMAAIQAIFNAILPPLVAFWQEHGDQLLSIANTIWGYIRDTIGNLMDIIRGIIKTVTSLISGDWSGAWEGIKGIAEGVWNQIKLVVETAIKLVRQVLDLAWPLIKDAAKAAWESVKASTVEKWNAVKGTVSDKLGDIKENVNTSLNAVRDNVRDKFAAVRDTARDLWGKVKDAIANVVRPLWGDVVGPAIQRVLDGWKDKFEKMRDATKGIVEAIKNFLNNLKNFTIPMPHFKFQIRWIDPGFGLPNFPFPDVWFEWYKKGGQFIATGAQLIGVGENGPELVTVEPLGGTFGGGRRGGSGEQTTQYILNYTAVRPDSGELDAARAMRRLELMARLRA